MASGLPGKEDFMTPQEWSQNEKYDGSQGVLKWKDVEQEKVFCVLSIEQKSIPGLGFDTFILHFVDDKNNFSKCFAPSHFIQQIQRNREKNFRPYFVSYGFTENGRKIAKFEISYKNLAKSFEIFEHIDDSKN